MSWSNRSASRIDLYPASAAFRLVGYAGGLTLATCVIAYSVLPLVTIVALPLICAAVFWGSRRRSAKTLLLASNSDQLSIDLQHYTLLDHATLAATVALRLEDSAGMRISVLMGPWNCTADDRRLTRLWLARLAGGSPS